MRLVPVLLVWPLAAAQAGLAVPPGQTRPGQEEQASAARQLVAHWPQEFAEAPVPRVSAE